MASTISIPLLDLLRGPTLRVRTGLWLVPPNQLDDVLNEAARAGIDTADMRDALLDVLPPNARFVGLNADRILALLNRIASQPAAGRCVLVHSLDLLLARLTVVQRLDVWEFVFTGFAHRPAALLFVMPNTAQSLLPTTAALEHWRQVGRVYPPN